MKKIKLRISPDGEVQHLYDDTLSKITSKICGGVKVTRASDVFFDEELQKWRVKLLTDPWKGRVLDRSFVTRKEAISYEVRVLEYLMRWSKVCEAA
jgi:hypothetical protein